jgi:hypothetical protein
MHPRLRAGRFLVLGLTAALLVIPASASAGTKSQSTTLIGNASIATLNPTCPKGQRATGGGFSAPAQANPSLSTLFVFESRKIGQRSWRVSGQILDPAASGIARTVTAFAYCSPGAPSTQSRSASVVSVSASYAFFTADAKCGSGKARAGGFLAPLSQSEAPVTDSYRADKKTWRSRMASAMPGDKLTSYVYCADEKKPAARSGSATSATTNTPHSALSAECRRGSKPVAGGFSQPTAAINNGLFQNYYESFKSGKRWRASGMHAGPGSTFNAIAYCA